MGPGSDEYLTEAAQQNTARRRPSPQARNVSDMLAEEAGDPGRQPTSFGLPGASSPQRRTSSANVEYLNAGQAVAKYARAASGDSNQLQHEPYGLEFKPQETSFGDIVRELPAPSKAAQFQFQSGGGSVRYPTSMDEFSEGAQVQRGRSGRVSFSANL